MVAVVVVVAVIVIAVVYAQSNANRYDRSIGVIFRNYAPLLVIYGFGCLLDGIMAN